MGKILVGKIVVVIFSMAVLAFPGTNVAVAASGKCTVTDVAGNKMVIECTKDTRGFDKGSKIKIKSEKKKPTED
jgi:hypothetical protein